VNTHLVLLFTYLNKVFYSINKLLSSLNDIDCKTNKEAKTKQSDLCNIFPSPRLINIIPFYILSILLSLLFDIYILYMYLIEKVNKIVRT